MKIFLAIFILAQYSINAVAKSIVEIGLSLIKVHKIRTSGFFMPKFLVHYASGELGEGSFATPCTLSGKTNFIRFITSFIGLNR